MVPLEQLLAFAVAAIAIILIPGPSVLFVIGRSIAHGRRAGVLSVVGNALGTVPAVVLVAVGLGAVVAQSAVAFTVVKLLGAGYLIYLGIQTVRHRRVRLSAAGVIDPVAVSGRRLLMQGFVVGVTNPKIVIFLVAVLPQFVSAGARSPALQMLELGVVFVILALTFDSMWAFVAGTARAWFAREPRRMERMTATGGVMLIGLGGVLALTRRAA